MTLIWSETALQQFADAYVRIRAVEEQRAVASDAEAVTVGLLRDPFGEGESRESDAARIWTRGRLTVTYDIRRGAVVEITRVVVSFPRSQG